MMLETANAADDQKFKGKWGEYTVVVVSEGEAYELWYHVKGRRPRPVAWKNSQADIEDAIREHEMAF